ncbi:MAG: hypothetical protein OHK0048_02350 [Rhodoferax sp.]
MHERDDSVDEYLALAARWVVEDGLDYASAKQRAARALGWGARAPRPDNAALEQAVCQHIALYCPQEQAQALRALRELALHWMRRLAVFRPHVGGAVWRGTATWHSDIELQLFCDDSKAAELHLLDQGLPFTVSQTRGFHGQIVDVLTLTTACPGRREPVHLHLAVYDYDDLRGALKSTARGSWRGDASALERLLAQAEAS